MMRLAFKRINGPERQLERTHACVLLPPFASLCIRLQGDGPVPHTAARSTRPHVHSELHQPATTPCLYLARPAWCTSHFVAV
jgi:hypothetical protein